ncbi:Cas10/Cmr2 second palm domain-containing protein [Clostridium algidicarnis]|uniref:Type III-B CRISPR-associated protein Cas10/Cmr2 n=1 Tax=Clostridium algidicarnis TaxID=37659 RepID=A0ABS6C2G0_9CLOT|nr:type III-B CRISPR-associated protein Cas10/Cmr2 [Clostridium algidicarnis]MBU3219622.1 type III-B CRISPR-associated protein Cas10/Cmr2 [Clostridium algidicarnis]
MSQNKTSRTYIGLTIGPIIETISQAKETGELWASSYLFSYIIKNIIKKLLDKNKTEGDNTLKDRFIVPSVENEKIFTEPHEVGLFHDRFIFESNEYDFELVNHAIYDVKKDIVAAIKEISHYKGDIFNDEILTSIDDFLKIYYLEVPVDTNGKKDYNNIILQVNKCLDALELKENLPSEKGEENNYLLDILSNRALKNGDFKTHFLSKDAYGNKGKEGNFPSLLKIALGETNNKDFPCSDDEIAKTILAGDLVKAQEYVAVVQVDGDFIGNVIKSFKINENGTNIYGNYKCFSNKLLSYSKRSNEIIKDYNGFTVYAGGDDLLFIAPIINKNCNKETFNRNIFELIDSLSSLFEEKFKCYKSKPTTSFGVAMVHHKFPLYYALDESRELLFEKAKKYKYKGLAKNAIAFKVIKSSGQSFETVVGKDTTSYKQFTSLFTNILYNSKKDSNSNDFLKAVHFKLLKDKTILNKIGKDKVLLENYFRNNFNEEIHKCEPIKGYIENLVTFIHEIYYDMEHEDIQNDICINQIYTYLRFIKFMDEKIK